MSGIPPWYVDASKIFQKRKGPDDPSRALVDGQLYTVNTLEWDAKDSAVLWTEGQLPRHIVPDAKRCLGGGYGVVTADAKAQPPTFPIGADALYATVCETMLVHLPADELCRRVALLKGASGRSFTVFLFRIGQELIARLCDVRFDHAVRIAFMRWVEPLLPDYKLALTMRAPEWASFQPDFKEYRNHARGNVPLHTACTFLVLANEMLIGKRTPVKRYTRDDVAALALKSALKNEFRLMDCVEYAILTHGGTKSARQLGLSSALETIAKIKAGGVEFAIFKVGEVPVYAPTPTMIPADRPLGKPRGEFWPDITVDSPLGPAAARAVFSFHDLWSRVVRRLDSFGSDMRAWVYSEAARLIRSFREGGGASPGANLGDVVFPFLEAGLGWVPNDAPPGTHRRRLPLHASHDLLLAARTRDECKARYRFLRDDAYFEYIRRFGSDEIKLDHPPIDRDDDLYLVYDDPPSAETLAARAKRRAEVETKMQRLARGVGLGGDDVEEHLLAEVKRLREDPTRREWPTKTSIAFAYLATLTGVYPSQEDPTTKWLTSVAVTRTRDKERKIETVEITPPDVKFGEELPQAVLICDDRMHFCALVNYGEATGVVRAYDPMGNDAADPALFEAVASKLWGPGVLCKPFPDGAIAGARQTDKCNCMFYCTAFLAYYLRDRENGVPPEYGARAQFHPGQELRRRILHNVARMIVPTEYATRELDLWHEPDEITAAQPRFSTPTPPPPKPDPPVDAKVEVVPRRATKKRKIPDEDGDNAAPSAAAAAAAVATAPLTGAAAAAAAAAPAADPPAVVVKGSPSKKLRKEERQAKAAAAAAAAGAAVEEDKPAEKKVHVRPRVSPIIPPEAPPPPPPAAAAAAAAVAAAAAADAPMAVARPAPAAVVPPAPPVAPMERAGVIPVGYPVQLREAVVLNAAARSLDDVVMKCAAEHAAMHAAYTDLSAMFGRVRDQAERLRVLYSDACAAHARLGAWSLEVSHRAKARDPPP